MPPTALQSVTSPVKICSACFLVSPLIGLDVLTGLGPGRHNTTSHFVGQLLVSFVQGLEPVLPAMKLNAHLVDVAVDLGALRFIFPQVASQLRQSFLDRHRRQALGIMGRRRIGDLGRRVRNADKSKSIPQLRHPPPMAWCNARTRRKCRPAHLSEFLPGRPIASTQKLSSRHTKFIRGDTMSPPDWTRTFFARRDGASHSGIENKIASLNIHTQLLINNQNAWNDRC